MTATGLRARESTWLLSCIVFEEVPAYDPAIHTTAGDRSALRFRFVSVSRCG